MNVGHAAVIVLAVAAMSAALGGRASASENGLMVPAVSYAAEGGGQARRVVPEADNRQYPRFLHFWYTPGHWIEWPVDGVAAGQYEVVLRYAAKQDVRRSLAVDGTPVRGLNPFTLPSTGSWRNWGEVTLSAPISVTAGGSRLRLICEDDRSVRLESLTLKGASGDALTLNAADFSAEGGGAAQALGPPTQGRVTDWQDDGHWLEWAFDAPAAGDYSISLHYAADGYCPRELLVNGEPVAGLEAFIPPPTGDVRHWTIATLPAAARLHQGRNTVRLAARRGPSRAVPRIDGEFELSAIRLAPVSARPKGSPGVMTMQDLAAAQKRSEPGEVSPPAPLGPPLPDVPGAIDLKEGNSFECGRQRVSVAQVGMLPYVANKFSDRYVYENYENPKVKQMLDRYDLKSVVAAGKDEFEQQLLLMKWVYDQWDFGHARELYMLRDPFWILEEARREHKFQCMHSAVVFMTAANSLGWVCRPMAIPRHSLNEVWSNQHRKWIQFDATSNYYPEKDGVPLNMYEHRQALLRGGGGVLRGKMGDNGVEKSPQSDSYGRRLLFVGYIPNTNHFDVGPDYANFFITKDELCEGRSWHTRDCPENPAVDPYFPVNQAALALVPDDDGVHVTIGTMTPNFREFQVRIGGGEWRTSDMKLLWPLHPGENKLEARSVNKAGVAGPISTVVLHVEP